MASVMDGMTEWMNTRIAPLAAALGQNKVLKAISEGMMQSMPLTVGVAAIAIIINLPIPGVSDFLVSSGLTAAGNEIVNAYLQRILGSDTHTSEPALRRSRPEGRAKTTSGLILSLWSTFSSLGRVLSRERSPLSCT